MKLAKILTAMLLALTTVAAAGCAKKDPGSHSAARDQASQAGQTQVIELAVTSDGFVPAEIARSEASFGVNRGNIGA